MKIKLVYMKLNLIEVIEWLFPQISWPFIEKNQLTLMQNVKL